MRLRIKKIESLIHREIGLMLQQGEIRDPRIGFVTVTRVDIAPDMRHGKVYISVLGTKKEQKRSLCGLHSARGFIQGEVARRVRLRYFPELSFFLDENAAHADKINKMIHAVHKDTVYERSHGSHTEKSDHCDTTAH